MHQIAPNCVSNVKKFPGGNTPDPHPGEEDTCFCHLMSEPPLPFI